MASSGVSDPELLERVYELETEKQQARLQAQQDQSLAQIAVKKLVESLDPEDLVPLVRLVIEAGVKARSRSEGRHPKTKTKTKTEDRNVTDPEHGSVRSPSPAEERVEDLEQ